MPENPIDVILRNEGGFVNDPDDHGGPTKYGITQAALRSWLHHQARVAEVANMTEATARRIYEHRYLIGPHIDTLPEPFKTHVLDIGVNRGPSKAIRMLQHVLNRFRTGTTSSEHGGGFGKGGGIAEDGQLGPATRALLASTIAKEGVAKVNNALVATRIAFYEEIIRDDPRQQRFHDGWMNRAHSFLLPVD